LKDPVVLLANGLEPKVLKIINFLMGAGTIICVDGGYELAKKLNIAPDVIIGDFDSTILNKKNDKKTKIIKVDNQNKTDLEKAIEFCISENLNEIFLIATNGKRDDHNLANILLMYRYFKDIQIKIITDYFQIETFEGTKLFNLPIGSQISLISLEENNPITSKGLRFELNRDNLKSASNGISNIVDKEKIEINSKKPLIIFQELNEY